MFIAIYQFDVKPGHEKTFVENWKIVTKAIYRHRGSLGSRLHRTSTGAYIAYAQWPSQKQFECEIPLPPEAQRARDRLKQSCTRQTLEFGMNVVADLLREFPKPSFRHGDALEKPRTRIHFLKCNL